MLKKHNPGKTEPDINALERNASWVKGTDWVCPKPVIVVVSVNGQSCCALIDSGSFSDFMSTTLADQLKVKLEVLDRQLPLQLVVLGSRGKVKVWTTVQFEYQKINEIRTFDIINVDSNKAQRLDELTQHWMTPLACLLAHPSAGDCLSVVIAHYTRHALCDQNGGHKILAGPNDNFEP